ncbi:cation:proton antiporter [Nocardia sp. NBC_01503]|uniref:cation:proton antiporter n=1 Tax=Nocardia sp. NBC_01503 TaxID=2975997 RepID=UPI002E7B4F01|nr:cation:proton antiporter [Nocardia sp. NBC_01503]WTL32197.1 cation:proton antiporter [Nocardia sp. NBC_01503]
MTQALIAIAGVVAAWSLLAARLERWQITAPVAVVLAGIAAGIGTRNTIGETLNTRIAQHAAEIVLAVLLFVDATEVRGGLFGPQPRAVFRMLFIALPLGLGLSVLFGAWLLPGLSWAVLLVIACVVVPIDFAPAAFILRDRGIPPRVRDVLNVEGGYNDGIVSPIFIFALALAGDASRATTPMDALGDAVPSAVKAILVGSAVGWVLAAATDAAEQRDLMNHQSKRMALVAAPILSYALAVAAGGNGFVAAFVSGLALNYFRRTAGFHRELELIDDIGFLLTMAMWFVFGSVAVYALTGENNLRAVLFALAALTVVRILPTYLAMLGSDWSWRDRLRLGLLGPRGTTSIVFGLLAFNGLTGEPAEFVLLTLVFTVLGSVLLHGAGAPLAARRRG